MTFDRGDLVLVPFPFTDLTTAKRRPVLALTAPDGFGDFIGLPVTSRPQHEHGLALTTADLASGALPLASWIRVDRPVSLSAGLVVKVVARVRDSVTDAAVARLCAVLGHPA
jgi:mRNA interferase MazF